MLWQRQHCDTRGNRDYTYVTNTYFKRVYKESGLDSQQMVITRIVSNRLRPKLDFNQLLEQAGFSAFGTNDVLQVIKSLIESHRINTISRWYQFL